VLRISALIEGFYDTGSNMMISDTVRTYLRNTSSPYGLVDSSKNVLNSSGVSNFKYTQTNNGTAYYLVVKHRNSIESWSKNGIHLIADTTNYDFTTDSAKAYGDNMAHKGTKWCIFGGDVNQDGIVDLTDLTLIQNDVTNFVSGYVNTDITGDQVVDLTDETLAYNNSSNFVSVISP
jgi:hypothetical protein